MKIRKWAFQAFLILIITAVFAAPVLAGATFSRTKVWSSGETLTASDLNAEFNNIINNFTPAGVDDTSSNATEMQATSDPYPGGVASLATSLEGEIQRLRYLIKQITGKTYWYIDPDTDLATVSTAISTNTPAGVIQPFAGSSAPTGWLLCYGQAVNRATYSTLFSAIGTTYGSGNGSTTFNLPDLRGRMIIGLDNMGGSAASRVAAATSLGQAAGAERANIAHTHTTGDVTLTAAQCGLPSHTHTIPTGTTGGGAYVSEGTSGETGSKTGKTGGAAASQAHNHGATGSGGSTTQAIMNPYMGLNYIIKY